MMLQKPVPPAMVQAYLTHGFDRVSGWVLKASDVANCTSVEQLRLIHQLGYRHSPYQHGEPLYILHFPSPRATPLVRANPEAMSELFALPADGMLTIDDISTPLWWVEHTRLPAGSRLWKFTAGGSQPELVATYAGPAFGWHNAAGEFRAIAPTIMTGRVAVIDSKAFACEVDYNEDDHPTTVTIAAREAVDEDFERTDAGLYAKVLAFEDVDLIFESHVQATYQGLPVRVVERFHTDGADRARIASLVLDYRANAQADFQFVEAGVWEANVGWDELTDVEPSQRVAKIWAREELLANSQRIDGQGEVETYASAARKASNARIDGLDPADPLASEQLQELYAKIAETIAKVAPAGAERVEVLTTCVDTNFHIAAQAVLPHDDAQQLPALVPEIAPLLAQLRMRTKKPERGAFFTAFLSVTPAGEFRMNLDYDSKPRLPRTYPAAVWQADLQRFARSDDHIPTWLRAALAGEDFTDEEHPGSDDAPTHETT